MALMSDSDVEDSEYDYSVYEVFKVFETGDPCMSFDFLTGHEYRQPQQVPYDFPIVCGTQSGYGKNHLMVCRLHNIHMEKKEGEEEEKEEESEESENEDAEDAADEIKDKDSATVSRPMFTHCSLPHVGCCQRIRCTDLGQDGNVSIPFAATWSQTGNVYLWDLKKPVDTLYDPNAMAAFSRRKQSSSKDVAYVIDEHDADGFALDWNQQDKGNLLTGNMTGQIRLVGLQGAGSWTDSGAKYDWHRASVEDLQWSPCERTVFASCSVDRSIAIWDTRASSRVPQLFMKNAHASDVNVINWSKTNPCFMLSGGDDGRVHVWDLRSMKPDIKAKECVVASFSYHSDPITSVEWHPQDESVFAASSEDNELTIWDLSVEKADPTDANMDSKHDKADDGEEDNVKLPTQLMFNHEGLKDIKELHWHPSIYGMIVSTSLTGVCVLKTVSA